MTNTVEELLDRKATLEGVIERVNKLYFQRIVEHDEHVQRSYFAVTTGILSLLNRNEKATATYRRSLNSDIQLHRKIHLRNLFMLQMRKRKLHSDLDTILLTLKEMGVEETETKTEENLDTTESAPAA